jgi:dienelactone hydrolase
MANAMVSPTDAPAGAERLPASWIKVTVPEQGGLIAAVTRPPGAGPFPAVLLLHGSHGFAQEYVRLAQELATRGLLGVAACWFREGIGDGRRFITPIDWPDAPPVPDPLNPEALRTVAALIQAVRSLPEALPNHVGLFGHSRGGGAALNYVLRKGDIRACVLNSARYPRLLTELVSEIRMPILMLHGTADNPSDGGTEGTNIEMARAFERAALAAGKKVEAVYYEGGRHNGLFDDPAQHRDEVERMATFLRLHLISMMISC